MSDFPVVSWIRKRDLHILTAGSTTYTSDQRFQVIRPENSGNWTLQIKYPQPRDSGIYECQINTEPKMSLSYTFNVIVSAIKRKFSNDERKFIAHFVFKLYLIKLKARLLRAASKVFPLNFILAKMI
uniref:Ig-like domain-containing protein n=1 Tax=Glossina pallidipes TaxID=7398 RepID=A0A1A9ZNM6_GLOPL